MNAYWEALDFELPPVEEKPDLGWYRVMDTSLGSPNDIADPGMEVRVIGQVYRIEPRSMVMLHYTDPTADVQP
jgi:glycogen operon protein